MPFVWSKVNGFPLVSAAFSNRTGVRFAPHGWSLVAFSIFFPERNSGLGCLVGGNQAQDPPGLAQTGNEQLGSAPGFVVAWHETDNPHVVWELGL